LDQDTNYQSQIDDLQQDMIWNYYENLYNDKKIKRDSIWFGLDDGHEEDKESNPF